MRTSLSPHKSLLPTTMTIRLLLFQTLDASQSNHGIPNQDYTQYHSYCSNRLNRIRHNKAVRSTLVHNHKYVPGVSGKKHAFCQRQAVPETIEHQNILYNLLYQAERAWAKANHVRQSKAQKLGKASHWAKLLHETTLNVATEDSQKESLAYLHWMKGNTALERKQFGQAYQEFLQTYQTLQQLAAEMQEETPESIALKDVWMNRAENIVLPLLRFCQYEANDVPAEQLQATKSSKKAHIVLSFKNQEIGLDSFKDLAVLHLKLEKSIPDIKTEEEAVQVINDLHDALELVEKERKHYANLPEGPTVTAKRHDLEHLRAYFQYQKVSVALQQQQKRLQDYTDAVDLVHLYESMQAQAQEMADLVDSDGAEEDPVWLEAQAHVLRIRALRCFSLAQVYETHLNGTPSQILSLIKQSEKLSRRAAEEISASEMDEKYLTELEELDQKCKAMKCRVEATGFLASKGYSMRFGNTDRPLLHRLDDMDAGTTLVDSLEPVPVPPSPVFLDLAHPGADFPLAELDQFIDERTPKKKSFFGLF